VAILAVLHHDFWNWSDASLVFGFLPVGLAWHAGYSVAACLLWALVTLVAWPTGLESWAEGTNAEIKHPPGGPR
jgi:hypothetical protein